MYIHITNEIFDNVRLDILNWVNYEMLLQDMGKTLNMYLKSVFERTVDMLVFIEQLAPDSFKPYYTFKTHNKYYTIHAVCFGKECVRLSPIIPKL